MPAASKRGGHTLQKCLKSGRRPGKRGALLAELRYAMGQETKEEEKGN